MFFNDLLTFLAMVSPISVLPMFRAMTPDDEYDEKERRRIGTKAVIAAFMMTTVFLVAGHYIMLMFGITIEAFRIGGGIIIFGVAMGLLHPSESAYLNPEEQQEGVAKHDISITPLAIPLISGPGTLTTTMALEAANRSITGTLVEFAAFAIVYAILWVSLRYSNKLFALMGHNGVGAMTRIFGLILAIIAVQMVIEGATPVVHQMLG